MGFEPGIGGTVGGPPTRLPIEIEMTAATLVAAQQSGKMANTDDVVFYQINSQNTWKYNSTANNPILNPMNGFRMAANQPKPLDESWTKQYAKLMNLLPPDVRDRLVNENQLLMEERSAEYAALQKVMDKTAKALAWLKRINEPKSKEEEALSQTDKNNEMPRQAAKGMKKYGSEVLAGIEAYIGQIGPNSPDFDKLLGLTNELKEMLKDFEQLSQQVESNKPSLSLLANDFHGLGSRLQVGSLGITMVVLKPTVDTFALMTEAMALKVGAPALLLGVGAATIGINTADSAAGILSPAITRFVNLLTTVFPKLDAGSRKFEISMINLLLIGASTLAELASKDKKMGVLVTDLILHIASGSGMLFEMTKHLVGTCGAKESELEAAGDALALGVFLMVFHSFSKSDKEAGAKLSESLSPQLIKWLDKLIHAKEVAGYGIGMYLQQGCLALKRRDSVSFMKVISDAFKYILHEDIYALSQTQGIEKFANVIWNYVSADEDQNRVKTEYVQF